MIGCQKPTARTALKATWRTHILLLCAALAVLGVPVAPARAVANTDNFTISSYLISYELARDTTGHSLLKTTETITAEFPNFDQNHGIERYIPTNYDGHSTHIAVSAVIDDTGAALHYSTYYTSTEGTDFTVLRIGNSDQYVHGTHTYTITYTQHDVTRFYADTQRDEWYWDTNGTGWRVPIEHFEVHTTLSADIQTALRGTPSCYAGLYGATEPCTVEATGTTYNVTANNLTAGENITQSFGFSPNTFAAYQPTLFERLVGVWMWALLIIGILGTGIFICLEVLYIRRRDRIKEQNPIVVEYIPPRGTSVLVAARIMGSKATGSSFAATLIDWAVRHYIELIETRPKKFFISAEYDIKVITDPRDLSAEEKELLTDIFDHLPGVGEQFSLKKLRNSLSYGMRTQNNLKKIDDSIKGEYDLRHKDPQLSRLFYWWAGGFLFFAVGTLSPLLLVLSVVLAINGALIRPLTDKGLALRRYLLGLDTYIAAAETERLRFLQGPDTAEKVGEPVDVNNHGQLVKLYERVLPYAILFHREKEWSKRLAEYYDTAQAAPTWYVSNGVFNAAAFSSALSSFSTTIAPSSGASSGSGGSTGGGFSGGGGGGGGGGGW